MPQSGIWRIALPLWDVPAVTGDAAPAADPAPPPSDDSGSLSDHEAAYGESASIRQPASEPAADAKTDATDGRERDDKTGQFKPRHRAKSQQATPDDVPRIAALTAKLRAAEERAEAAEAAARRPLREEPAVERRQPEPERFPKFEKWIQQPGVPETADHDDYLDARDAWRDEQRERLAARTATERAIAEDERKFEADTEEARKEYPDFDDVVTDGIRVSLVLQRATLKAGPKVAYWLATHPTERDELSNESLVHPDNPAFSAAVAGMRRYLSTLVASEQRPASSSRAAAGSTGAAPTLVPKPAPKPPTPGRTSALRDADAPPGDDEGLAAHERYYGPKARRA